MSDSTPPAATPRPSTSGASKRWEPPSPEELQALMPGYTIEKLLGKGGMGAVYQGIQTNLDRPVAIKIISNDLDEADASYGERFKNEAKAMAKLNHPGIVAVHDYGQTTNGILYIVMEFVEGTDVAKMIAQQKRLHTDHAMAVTAHVCDALAYAHERNIIHRDIKPANIMVGYDGVVKVADFGLAKMTQSGESGLTQSGMAMGTLHYMAPEALMLGSSVDHRADIYAVGVMLYQMLTGKLPQGMFELPSLQVPGLDPRYDGIIAKALRDDRELRYQSVRELRGDLDSILTQPVVQVDPQAAQAPAALPTTARPRRPAGQPYRPPQQSQAPVYIQKKSSPLLWAALIMMCGVAGWLFFKDSKRDDVLLPYKPPATVATTTNVAVLNTPTLSRDLASATKDTPFVNTLGMRFVPVPGTNVLMCIHETRKGDYAAFAAATLGTDGSWKNPTLQGLKVSEGDDHPVVNVNSFDAEAFCKWLSKKEDRSYRLQSWREWGWAVGTGPLENEDAPLAEVKAKVAGIYPWGRGWPPPKGTGNIADEALKTKQPTARIIAGYQDGYATTAPVMSFPPNEIGIYDLCGNVSEWCGDITSKRDQRKLRSSSWSSGTPNVLMSSQPGDGGQSLTLRWADIGFRVVLELSSSSASTETIPTPAMTDMPAPTPKKTTTVAATQAPPMPPAKPAEVAVKESISLILPTGPTIWTDTQSRTITATFKAIASGNVLLDIAGKVRPVPLNTLSAESQKLARDYQQQIKPSTLNTSTDLSAAKDDATQASSTQPKNLEEALLNFTWEWTHAPKPADELTFHKDGTATCPRFSWHWKITGPRTAIAFDAMSNGKQTAAYKATLQFDADFKTLDAATDDGTLHYTGRRMNPNSVTAANSAAQPSKIPADALSFGKSRFAFFAAVLTWKEAKAKAEALGGHLATITTAAEDAWVIANFESKVSPGRKQFWIGASQERPNRPWQWVTGETFSYTQWAPSEPNNAKGTDLKSITPYMLGYLIQGGRMGWNDFSESQTNWRDIIVGYLVEWDR